MDLVILKLSPVIPWIETDEIMQSVLEIHYNDKIYHNSTIIYQRGDAERLQNI